MYRATTAAVLSVFCFVYNTFHRIMLKIFSAETSDVFPGITPRNKAHFDYEQFIHRTFYPYIIHPYSRFRVYYEISFLVLIPLKSLLFFFVWFFLEHDTVAYHLLMTSFNAINFVDVFLRFFTGYVETDTEIVVLDPKKIARKYFFGLFIIDILPAIPWDFIVFFIDKNCTPKRALMAKPCHVITFLSLFCIIFRFATFLRYSTNTSRIMCWNPFLPTIICIPYFYVQIILTQLGFLLLFGTYKEIYEEESLWDQSIKLLDMFVWFAFDLIFIGTAFPVINAGGQVPVLMASLIFSVCFTAYLIKYILGKMKPKENIYRMESRVKCFAQKKHLPILLKHKTLLYFHILLQNKYHKEEKIFHYVPNTFKADIFFHFCLPLLKGFRPFEDFPTYVLRRLAERLKYQLYLPNQYVISTDTNKLTMYFIQKGAVALYSAKNTELYHFETGSSVNGRYMIEGKPNVNHYVISIEVTEVYCLDRKDFSQIMENYPDLLEQMKDKLNLNRTTSGWL